jgi:purine-binding chemotaxis protein CheW
MVSFIVFTVGEQKFVYETDKVVETVKVDRVFPVPKAPDYLRGVINLRNNVIPILDTGKLLWDKPIDSDTLLIVSEENGDVGLLVSRVLGIVSIDEEELKNAEGVDIENIKEEFVRGIIEREEDILMLFNLKPVLDKSVKRSSKTSKKRGLR